MWRLKREGGRQRKNREMDMKKKREAGIGGKEEARENEKKAYGGRCLSMNKTSNQPRVKETEA